MQLSVGDDTYIDVIASPVVTTSITTSNAPGISATTSTEVASSALTMYTLPAVDSQKYTLPNR